MFIADDYRGGAEEMKALLAGVFGSARGTWTPGGRMIRVGGDCPGLTSGLGRARLTSQVAGLCTDAVGAGPARPDGPDRRPGKSRPTRSAGADSNRPEEIREVPHETQRIPPR